MDAILLARQGLLFLHLVAFAIAFAEIARADLRLLRAPRIDAVALHRAAQVVSPALLALWASGIGLIVLDKGLDLSAIAASPKLLVKLIVVTVLTANGMLLHRYAFPILARHEARSGGAIAILAALGAVSTVSWLYAAFVGSARLIAGTVSLQTFLALYGIGLVTGIATAILMVGRCCGGGSPQQALGQSCRSITRRNGQKTWRAT